MNRHKKQHSDILTCKHGNFQIEVAAILDFTYSFPMTKSGKQFFYF